MSLHGGVIEAVSAAQIESVRAFREKAREKSVPVSGWVATGASEARSSVVRGPKGIPHLGKTWGKVEEHAPTAMRDPPKRSERRETLSSPVSTGGNPLSARQRRPKKPALGTMNRNEAGYGCSLSSVGKQKRIGRISDLAPTEGRKIPVASGT